MGTFGIIPVVLILTLLSHCSANNGSSDTQFNRDALHDSQINRRTSCMNLESCIIAQVRPNTLEGVQSNNKSSSPIYFVDTRNETTVTDDTIQEKIPESITEISCKSAAVPNGKLKTTNGTHVGDTATLHCNDGYKMYGESTTTCMSSGKWSSSGSCIIVDCSAPPVPPGATVSTPNGTKYGTDAYLNCSTEYRMKGNSIITCQDDGTWSKLPSCEIIDCGKPKLVNGMMSAPEGTTFGQTASMSCDDGYTLLGNDKIKCTSTGKWDGSATCKAKDCGELPIVNGKMSGPEGTTFGKTVTLSCDDGYTLLGNANIKCASTGKWDGSATCKAKDCGELPIVNGKMSGPEGTTFGKTASMSCDDGYTLLGNDKIKCTSTGKWDGSATCKAKDCGELQIVNGKMSAPEGTTFGKTVTMSCDDGYTLLGNANIKCASTGKWDGSATCKVKDCGELQIVNGKMSAPEGTTFGKTVTMSCDDGYTLLGNANIKCASTGKWDGSATCKVKDCGELQIVNGKMSAPEGTTFGKTVTMSCDDGYTLLGNANIKCASTGKWDGSATCKVKDCGELQIVNGKMSAPEGTTFGKTVTMSCDDGYTLLGNANIKCASTGKWDGSATCKVKDCGELQIVNGKMSAPEGTTFGKTVTMSCDDGYTLLGNANIKCASTGKWDGSATCKVKDCGELQIVNGKMSAPEGTTFGKTVTMSCDDGYKLLGNANIKCASTGKWDGSEIQSIKCTEIDECESNPCKNNGKCVDQVNGYNCQCNKNYSGKNCDKDTGPCSRNPCQNGGTCLYDGNGVDFCSCTEYCENPICSTCHKNRSKLKRVFKNLGKIIKEIF